MDEFNYKTLIEKSFQNNGVVFKKEFPLQYGFIDYCIDWGGKKCGVEVKTNKSKVFWSVGQIVNAKNTFSHIFLLAPMSFLKKFEKIAKTILDTLNIGLMTFEAGNTKVVKEPLPPEYYFEAQDCLKKPKKKPNCTFMTENDMEVLSMFENNIIQPFVLAKKMKMPVGNVYAKLSRLRRMGIIERIGEGNPITFKIINRKQLGDIIYYA